MDPRRLGLDDKPYQKRAILRCPWYRQSNEFRRREPRHYPLPPILPFYGNRTEITLVEPRAGLLRQDARHPFAVQVEPLVARTVQVIGQVLEAFGVYLPDLILNGGLGYSNSSGGRDRFRYPPTAARLYAFWVTEAMNERSGGPACRQRDYFGYPYRQSPSTKLRRQGSAYFGGCLAVRPLRPRFPQEVYPWMTPALG